MTSTFETPGEQRSPRRAGAWVGPSLQAEGLPRYLEVLRSGLKLIVASLVLCIGGAVLYLSQAEKVYEADADLIVTPLPRELLTVPVPGLIQQSPDPTRDVETVARLVASPSVARRVKAELNLTGTSKQILRKVQVAPVAQSNIVSITAEGGSPREAQRLANAFAEQMVADRTERMRDTLKPIIAALKRQAGSGASTPESLANPNSPRNQLFVYETLNEGEDPTVRVESAAERPTEQASPRPVLTLAAAGVAGLTLGLIGAFGRSLLDPRLRREEQLRQRFRLPILARIPVERGRKRRPLLPTELSMGALDSYQTLRAALGGSGSSVAGRVVLVTGPSPGDGKTTSAINLASVLAAAGKRVVLIEADSRRPSMGRALGVTPEIGLANVITGRSYLVDALIPIGGEDSKLRVLLTSPDEAPTADVLSEIAVETLLLQAQKLADWVIVDSPPLNHVAETMTLARMVDDVLIVVRLGRSNLRDMEELAEMLVQQDIEPAGFVLLSGQARPGYY